MRPFIDGQREERVTKVVPVVGESHRTDRKVCCNIVAVVGPERSTVATVK
jgi:hypothetical protein